MNLLVSTEGITTTALEAAELGVTTGDAVLMLKVASLDGLAIGMRIAPCYPAPSASVLTNFITRLGPTEYFIKVNPNFTSECVNYSVNIYEPSSLTPTDIFFDAGFTTAAAATARLSGGIVLLHADFSTNATASARLSGANVPFKADFSTVAAATAKITASREIQLDASFSASAVAAARLTGFTVGFGASYAIEATAKAKLTGAAVFFSAGFGISAAATASLTGTESANGVSLCAVVKELLNLWGIEGVCNAPDFAVERALNDVNGAMQTIWNQAADRNYWTSSTLTLTFSAGVSSQDLPSNIQNVVGPCRRSDNRRPLATIGTIGELETFSDLYLDGETADEPLAYHIERMNQSGQDPAKTVLHVTPPVTGADMDLLLEVVTEAPRFYVGDLSECPILPIPHRYTESLFMPILRYKASSFWLFNNSESKPTIDRDYQLAMEAIGAADPLPGKSGDNKEAAKK